MHEPAAPVKILALVGSLRKASVHRMITAAIVDDLPSGIELEVLDLADLPLYNGDDEEAGPPAPVQKLVAKAEAADGLLIISPEYNSSFPALTRFASFRRSASATTATRSPTVRSPTLRCSNRSSTMSARSRPSASRPSNRPTPTPTPEPGEPQLSTIVIESMS